MARISQRAIDSYFKNIKRIPSETQKKPTTKRSLLLIQKCSKSPKISNVQISIKSPKKMAKKSLKSSAQISHLEKYRSENKKLLLPAKFEALLSLFDAVESVMALHYSRNLRFVDLQKLGDSVQTITKRNFSLTDLCRIINVVPEALALKRLLRKDNKDGWRILEKLALTLLHNFKPDFDLTEKHFYANQSTRRFRRSVFHKRLVSVVCAAHQKFMVSSKLEKIDPFLYNEWHADFPLEEVSPPLPSSLPPKLKRSQKSLNFAKMKNDTKNGKFGAHFEFLAGGDLSQRVRNAKTSTFANANVLSGIDSKVIRKIREKARIVDALQQNKCERAELKIMEELKTYAKVTNEIFITSRKTKMPLSLLSEEISRRKCKGILHSKETAFSRLKSLAALPSPWSRLSGRNRNIFQIDKKIPFKRVMAEIATQILSAADNPL